MSVVLDNSIALTWCFEDERTPATQALLRRVARTGALAPALFPIEAMNALVVAERRNRIDAAKRAVYASFLRANRVPSALQKRIRGWAGFKLLHDRTDEQLQEVMGLLPENLRNGVAQVLTARTACQLCQGWCPP